MSLGGGGVQRTVTELNPTQEPFVEYGLQEAKNLYQTQDTPQFSRRYICRPKFTNASRFSGGTK